MVVLLCKGTAILGSVQEWRVVIIYRTEKERPFSAAKSFNISLVHFLSLHHITISIMHVCSFIGTISHVHGLAPKMVLCAQNFGYEN